MTDRPRGSALSPQPEATASPHGVHAPLACFIPLQAPSMNSLLTIIWPLRKLETKAEVRLFRHQLKTKLPRWECPAESLLSVTLRFHQPWYYANGKLKRQDAPNLIKCCLDCLADRYHFDDARVWRLCCEKVEDTAVGIVITILDYTGIQP